MFDFDGRKAREEGRLYSDHARGASDALVYFFRLFTFPIWFPFHLVGKRKEKRRMAEFAMALSMHGVINHEDVALQWVLAHPDKYRYAEHDPALLNVQAKFRKMFPDS